MPKPKFPSIKAHFVWMVHWRSIVRSRNGQLVQPADFEEYFADQLRYDSAFAHPDMPGIVVTFRMLYPGRGASHGQPNIPRWESFSGQIEPANRIPFADRTLNLSQILSEKDKWFTYEHERRTYKLVRMTLAQVLSTEVQ